MSRPLTIVPLGGLGEVGMNSMAIGSDGSFMLIDSGVMFPTAEMPGVDVVVPDFSFILERRQHLKGIVLTHGHEDHVGALSWLLRHVEVPVWGRRFTLDLVQERLSEAGIRADLREMTPRESVRVDERFVVEPFHVTHSTPDACGLIIRTPEGILVHTGDFKLDPTPLLGGITDLERLGEVGDEGVLCLLSDSTNSDIPGEMASEKLVADTFERLFTDAPGRIVVAVFASNLHRVANVLLLAERLGRKVALLGRSMQRNVEIAQRSKMVDIPSNLIVSPEQAAALPPEQVLLLVTGAQAEPRSALNQLLSSELLGSIGTGDRVIISARPIPGNSTLR